MSGSRDKVEPRLRIKGMTDKDKVAMDAIIERQSKVRAAAQALIKELKAGA